MENFLSIWWKCDIDMKKEPVKNLPDTRKSVSIKLVLRFNNPFPVYAKSGC